jgi:hypothetical protein
MRFSNHDDLFLVMNFVIGHPFLTMFQTQISTALRNLSNRFLKVTSIILFKTPCRLHRSGTVDLLVSQDARTPLTAGIKGHPPFDGPARDSGIIETFRTPYV